MLVLTRKKDEAIIIGEGIKITVLSVGEDQVKLGIEAPREVAVHREEIYRAIQAENREAATSRRVDLEALARLLPATDLSGEAGKASGEKQGKKEPEMDREK